MADIIKRSNEYWQKKANSREDFEFRRTEKTLSELKSKFADTTKEIEKEISAFYQKYGITKNSPIFKTLPDGTEVIDKVKVRNIVTYADAQKYNRLNSLQKQLDLSLSKLAKEQKTYMTDKLKLLASDSYNRFYFDVFQGTGVGYSFDLLDAKLINELIKSDVGGDIFTNRILGNNEALRTQMKRIVRNGLIQGVSTTEMSTRLSKKMDIAFKAAQTLMRTEISNTYNQATLQGYESSGIAKRYKYLATLDDRTSQVCRDLDGKIFKVSDAKVGLNYPPMHTNCRSTTVSIFDDAVFTRTARDKKGKIYTVPSNMTYRDWEKQRSELEKNL